MGLAIVTTGIGASVRVLALTVAKSKIDTRKCGAHQLGIPLNRKSVVWTVNWTNISCAQKGYFGCRCI